MRPDANRIAFRALRAVLSATAPLELDVGGTFVKCQRKSCLVLTRRPMVHGQAR